MWDFHAHLDFYAQDELDRSLAELEKDDLRVLASSVDPDSCRITSYNVCYTKLLR